MTSSSVSLAPIQALRQNMSRVFVGKEEAVELILTALLCGGHVLIEDVPGLGKTTLVSSLARSLGCSFARIQFTPDVMPADVTGYTHLETWQPAKKKSIRAASCNQIVLADEINRTGPKTQSALLEAMQERQVSIDGVTYPLPTPFMVLATQNPAELTGTLPLSRSTAGSFSHAYFSRLSNPRRRKKRFWNETCRESLPLPFPASCGLKNSFALQEAFHQVRCAQSILDYIISLADATRHHEQIALGISTAPRLPRPHECRQSRMPCCRAATLYSPMMCRS